MKSLKAWPALILIAAVGACGAWVFLLKSFHQFDKVASSFDGSCTPISDMPGPEDIQIDPAQRRAFVSSYDRRAKGARRGAIMAFSIDDPLAEDAWRDRTDGAPVEFEPLGLYFYVGDDVRRLFVVNAAAKTVELFDVDDNGDLKHLESFSERRLTSPNDVVAVGPRAFYVTNDIEPGRASLLDRLRFQFRIRSGRVLYFDGVSWRIAAEDLSFANGIAVSPDGARLYVAETAASALRIYDRDIVNGALALQKTVAMGAAVDNINIDRHGSLWIGAHPKQQQLASYIRNPDEKLPSLVLRYDDHAGGQPLPRAIYADDGTEISASTSAAKLGSTLLIGALLEKKLLICTLPAATASR